MEPLSSGDPTQVAGYQIRARLGAGGMGRVYLAYTPGGRPVALKLVRPEFDADPTFRTRFRHEVDAARRVHGLYTAQVLDADPDATPPWLVTAYVPGPSLQQAVAKHGPMPPDTVFQLMAGVAEALAAIHAVGVVHRDLKPSNVILAPDGPRVIDFGIAQAADASAITRQGIRVGSPQFMAPEQIEGRPPASAVDVFALGHLAAYAILGRSPFETDSGDAAAVFARILNQPPDLTGCPQPLRALIERCLSKDPDTRPAPAAVVAACREHQHPQTVQIAETWLPPAMAAAMAQHAAPPPPPPPPLQPPAPYAAAQPYAAQPLPRAPIPPQPVPTFQAPPMAYAAYSADAVPQTQLQPPQTQPQPGVYIPRTTMMRAAVGVVVIGAVIGLGVVFLHGTSSAGPDAPPHSSPAAVAAASNSQPLTTGPASPSAAAGLDPCVIGTWKGVSETVANNINGEPAEFTGPGPANLTLRPDGTGEIDYGGETLSTTVSGEAWTEVVDGSAMFHYQTSNGSALLTDIQSSGTQTLYLDGIEDASAPLSTQTSSLYTCSGNTLRLAAQAGTGSTELTRTS